MHHHHEGQRLTPQAAFHAHTRGGALAARDDDAGLLIGGHRADLAIWDLPGRRPGGLVDGLPDLTPGTPLPVLRRLVAAGVHHPRP